MTGRVTDPGLAEISGVVASRRFDGVLWVHEDSGAPAVLTAITPAGRALGTYAVAGASAVDWEDVAAADGQLFIGDIGDNRGTRDLVTVYRVPEPATRPDGRGGRLTGTVTFHLRYPTGPADAEALLVDPITGDLLILTKALLGQAAVLRAPAASLVDGATVTMEEAGSVRIPLITAADVSADGRRLVVRTYAQVLDFERPPGATVAATLQGAPCAASDTAEPQGEAIALTDGGTAYLTISEGRFPDIHRVALAEPRMEGWFAGTLDTAVDAAVAATRRARPSS